MRKPHIFVLSVLSFLIAQAGFAGDPALAQQSQQLRAHLSLPPDKYLVPGAEITGRVIVNQSTQQKIDSQSVTAALQRLVVKAGKQSVPVNKDGLFVFKLPEEPQKVSVRVYDPKDDDPIQFIWVTGPNTPPMYEGGRLISVPWTEPKGLPLWYEEQLRRARGETGIHVEAPPEAQPGQPYTVTGNMPGGGNGLDTMARFGQQDAPLLWQVTRKEGVFVAAFDASAVQPEPQIFSLLKSGKVVAEVKVKGLPSVHAQGAGPGGQSAGSANTSTQNSTQTSAGQQLSKPQGLTREDEEKIRKALHPDQTPGSAVASTKMGQEDWEQLRQLIEKYDAKQKQPQEAGQSAAPAHALIGRIQSAMERRAEILQHSLDALPTSQKTTPTNVSLVLPAQATGMISGTVLTEQDHPEKFKSIPGLQVVEFGQLPLLTGNDGSPYLGNLVVDTGNHVWQPANRPILLQNLGAQQTVTLGSLDLTNPATVKYLQTIQQQSKIGGSLPSASQTAGPAAIEVQNPSGQSQAQFSGFSHYEPLKIQNLHQAQISVPGPTVRPVEHKLPVNWGDAPVQWQSFGSAYSASPACFPGVEAFHGSLSGNLSQMWIEWGDKIVSPVAANQEVALYSIPDGAAPGLNQVTFVDGTQAASWTMLLLKMTTSVDQPVLHRGGKTNGHIGLQAGSYSSDPKIQKTWLPNNFRMKLDNDEPTRVNKIEPLTPRFDRDLLDVNKLQQSFPNFNPETAKGHFVFLGINSLSPTIALEGGPVQFFSLPIESLPLEKTLRIKATADGPFDIQVVAQVFSPLVPGQPLEPVHVPVGDISGEGHADVITGPGPSVKPNAPSVQLPPLTNVKPIQNPPPIVVNPDPSAPVQPPVDAPGAGAPGDAPFRADGAVSVPPDSPRKIVPYDWDFNYGKAPRTDQPTPPIVINPEPAIANIRPAKPNAPSVHTPSDANVTIVAGSSAGSAVTAPPINSDGGTTGTGTVSITTATPHISSHQPPQPVVINSEPAVANVQLSKPATTPKLPGSPKPPEIKLMRGKSASMSLYSWHESVILQELKGLPDFPVPGTPQSESQHQRLQQPITVEAIAMVGPKIYEQLRSAQGQPQNCSFTTSNTGPYASIHDTFNFQHCLITEVGFPALDAARKEAAYLTIKIDPEWESQKEQLVKQPVPASPARAGKPMATPNFKLVVPGVGSYEFFSVKGLPTADQLHGATWSETLSLLRLAGTPRWYEELLKPRQGSCSIVVEDSFNGGNASRRYDITKCWPITYTGPQFDANSSSHGLESITLQHEGAIRTK